MLVLLKKQSLFTELSLLTSKNHVVFNCTVYLYLQQGTTVSITLSAAVLHESIAAANIPIIEKEKTNAKMASMKLLPKRLYTREKKKGKMQQFEHISQFILQLGIVSCCLQ